MFMCGIISYGQECPRYIDDSTIAISVKQAQKIDNDLELLSLYRNMHTNCDSTVGFFLQVVDNYKDMDIIAQQKIVVYDSLTSTQKKQISNLKEQIQIKEDIIAIKDSVIGDKDKIITVDDKQIKQLKREKRIFIIGGAIFNAVLLYLIIIGI